jgi:hypothetical protein
VGDFPDLLIPLVADFIQEVHKLSISGKGFVCPCVSRLGRELKYVPEVPQRERKFFQLGFVSLRREKASDIFVLGALWSLSSDHQSCGP